MNGFLEVFAKEPGIFKDDLINHRVRPWEPPKPMVLNLDCTLESLESFRGEMTVPEIQLNQISGNGVCVLGFLKCSSGDPNAQPGLRTIHPMNRPSLCLRDRGQGCSQDVELLRTLLSTKPLLLHFSARLIFSLSSSPKASGSCCPWKPHSVPTLRTVPRAAWPPDGSSPKRPEAEGQVVAGEAGTFHPGAFTTIDWDCLS